MKRTIDFILALIVFIVAFPLLVVVALMVRLKLGPSVIFTQIRPGLQGKPFRMYKFKSMVDKYDQNGIQLPDSERLNLFGRFLRSTSIDELPELVNVIIGDMSLVGPRPLLMEYLPLYSEEQSRRHEVRPGITGWAQVNGRNAISWEDKFDLDVWYVDNQSLLLDIKILFLTVKKVLIREGITEIGSITASPFRGNDCESKDI